MLLPTRRHAMSIARLALAALSGTLFTGSAAAQTFSIPTGRCEQPFWEGVNRSTQVGTWESTIAQLDRVINTLQIAADLPPAVLEARIAVLRTAVAAYRASLARSPSPQPARQTLLGNSQLELDRLERARSRPGEELREAVAVRARLAGELAALRPAALEAMARSRACVAGRPIPAPLPAFGTVRRGPNLNGDWVSREGDGPWLPIRVAQTEDQVQFVDPYGFLQVASVDGSAIVALLWRAGMAGEISADAREIRWENGLIWRRR